MIKEGKQGISTMEAVGVYGRIIVRFSIGIPGQHSYLKCNYYQRKEEGGKKGPACSKGLSALSVLMTPLIQATFINSLLQFSPNDV